MRRRDSRRIPFTFDPEWTSHNHTRRRRYRYAIAASHHVTWFLGKQFPHAFPLLFVLGFPKSGTSWVCQMVADYLRVPFPQNSLLPIGFPAVVHGHELVTSRYPRAIYVLRDGRDAMVSLYFHYLAMTEKRQPGDDAAGQPARLPFASFVEQQLRRPWGSPANWGEHARSYFNHADTNCALIRYEEMLSDPEDALQRVLRDVTNEECNPQRVREAVQRFAFQQQSGRATGEEDRKSYLRKGQAGDWVNHFSPEAAKAFAQHCGDMLIAAGYEQNDGWVRQFSRRMAA
ncbi:MAG: sulfotransferase domain-containing protein [Pirellulaceae bacterium]|nr:sulfotransferase domain-containing protein [Planctomycetales bacterium]